ncbi:MAG TPA: hypothetical protein VKB95_10955 [Chitinophagaceae bacterium]|nr:hypothetical protein [Chitinophagaceae bacterium]
MNPQKLSTNVQKVVDHADETKFIDLMLKFNPLDPSTSPGTSSLQPLFLVQPRFKLYLKMGN